MASISLSEPVLRSYFIYSSILAIKVFVVSHLTTRQRIVKKIFANEEDAKFNNGVTKLNDPDVERLRRAHLNDLENIPAFWILGAMYVTTSPSAAWATVLFRVLTASRVLHTIAYTIKPMPQPARFIAFAIPMLIMWYMAIQVIMHNASFL